MTSSLRILSVSEFDGAKAAELVDDGVRQRLINLSFSKIVNSRNERGGAKLHKNLLVLHLLQRARSFSERSDDEDDDSEEVEDEGEEEDRPTNGPLDAHDSRLPSVADVDDDVFEPEAGTSVSTEVDFNRTLYSWRLSDALATQPDAATPPADETDYSDSPRVIVEACACLDPADDDAPPSAAVSDGADEPSDSSDDSDEPPDADAAALRRRRRERKRKQSPSGEPRALVKKCCTEKDGGALTGLISVFNSGLSSLRSAAQDEGAAAAATVEQCAAAEHLQTPTRSLSCPSLFQLVCRS